MNYGWIDQHVDKIFDLLGEFKAETDPLFKLEMTNTPQPSNSSAAPNTPSKGRETGAIPKRNQNQKESTSSKKCETDHEKGKKYIASPDAIVRSFKRQMDSLITSLSQREGLPNPPWVADEVFDILFSLFVEFRDKLFEKYRFEMVHIVLVHLTPNKNYIIEFDEETSFLFNNFVFLSI